MARTAKPSDPQQLERLKHRVQDSTYLNEAIYRIASALTQQIVQEIHRSPDNPGSAVSVIEHRFDRR